MRNEREFNSCIGRSLDWHFKIPDDSRCEKPFDGFGIVNGKSIYWEAKFIHQPEAFNFHRLEDHQLRNLREIKSLNPDAICIVIIGVVFGRGDIRAFIFDDLDEIARRKEFNVSIKKKEWLQISDYLKVSSGYLNFCGIPQFQ